MGDGQWCQNAVKAVPQNREILGRAMALHVNSYLSADKNLQEEEDFQAAFVRVCPQGLKTLNSLHIKQNPTAIKFFRHELVVQALVQFQAEHTALELKYAELKETVESAVGNKRKKI